MGFIQQLLTTRAAGHPSQHSLAAIFGLGRSSYAGVPVTDESAMTYSAVFAAIRLLSWSTAMLPLLTYRRQDRGKVRAEDHPLYPLLKEEANPEMTAFDFRSTLMSHAVGRGNGYAEIEWSTSGQPIALWPLNPAKTTAERVNGQLRYLVQLPDGTTANLPSWRVHHVRGLSGNGIIGYSPVRLAMQAIGLGLATEEFGSRFFGNGARPGLIVRHPGQLSDTAFDRLKKSFNADHEGLSNSHRVKILEEGMEIETVGVPPEEAQFLETRKFQVTEIARWFNVPPHMIADMSGATFSNIEEQGVEFVTYSLGPWLTNVEQALARDLLTPAEKKVLLIEHLVDGLLRGRTSERYAAYQSALQGGWMSPNEVRERENLNPYEGGDTYLLPLNMAPADSQQRAARAWLESGRWWERDQPFNLEEHHDECQCRQCRGVSRETDRPPSSSPQGGGRARASSERRSLAEDRRNLFEAYVPMMEDVAARMVRREVQDVERALGKHIRQRNAASFIEWLETYYAGYGDVVGEAFTPVIFSLAQLVAGLVGAELNEDPVTQEEISEFVEGYVRDLGEGAAASSRGQLVSIVQAAETQAEGGAIQDYIKDKISDRLQGWLETKARRMGRNQAFRAGNGLIIGNYTIKGVRSIEWLTNSGACAFCAKLDGKVVAIEEYFVQNGESLTGGADDAPMKMRSNKKHGPLHEGCSCTVRAGERQSGTQAPTNNPYGPKAPKPVVGETKGADAARQLRQLDPYQARLDYMAASDEVDLRLFQADQIRKDLRNLDDGIYPEYLRGDPEGLAVYRQRLEEELDAAVAVHITALDNRDALRIAQDQAYAKAEAETKKLLGGGDYFYFPEFGNGLQKTDADRAAFDEADQWLSEFVTSKQVSDNIVRFNINVDDSVTRSFYRHATQDVVMRAGESAATYVHEIAHGIDLQNDKVKNAALDFYNRRTAGLAEELLSNFGSGYGSDERCKPDDFMSAYCGKLPNSDGATEIISMGMQFMYEDPVRFATEDPEYFAFIYDLFRK